MKKIILVVTTLLVVVSALAGFVPGQVTRAYACQDGKPCEGAPGQQGDNAGGGGQQDECHKHDPDGGLADCPGGTGDDGGSDHNNGGGNDADRCDDNKGDDKKCQDSPSEEDPSNPPTEPVNPPAGENPTDGGETSEPGNGKEPTIEVDGNDIPFGLEPYEAPEKVEDSDKPVECPDTCCCECQSNLDWFKPWMFFALLGVLLSIALALVGWLLFYAIRHPFATLILLGIIWFLVGMFLGR